MIDRADIVVIGGGSTGSSVAYHLASKGAGKVVLLEKEFIAYGATGRSVAVVRQHYSIEILAKMARRSLKVFERFGELVGGEAGFVRAGLLVAAGQEQLPALEATVKMNRSIGADTRLIEPREAEEIMPGLNTDGIAGFAYETEAGYADSSLTAVSYAKRAEEMGAQVYIKTEAHAIEVKGGEVKGVQTSQGRIMTERVVVAANVWSPKLCKPLGIELPITPIREQIVLLRRPPDFRMPHPVYFDFVSQIYMRSERGDITMLGSMSPDIESKVANPDGFNPSIDYEFITEYGARSAERYPPLARANLFGGWSGLYDVTPDWQPILDYAPGLNGLFLAVGFSGHGFKLCPALGDMLSDLILKGKRPGEEINLFAFDRFERHQLIRAPYGFSVVS